RASAALPLLDDVITSPASRRLASARPALAPKCKRYSLTGPNFGGPAPGLLHWLTGWVTHRGKWGRFEERFGIIAGQFLTGFVKPAAALG
ncbi:MAG: hypothetical protein ABSH28_11135, partial [Acidobacteriota bacterium]